MIFEKLKKIVIAYIANNFKLSNKLTKVNNHLGLKLNRNRKSTASFSSKIAKSRKTNALKIIFFRFQNANSS